MESESLSLFRNPKAFLVRFFSPGTERERKEEGEGEREGKRERERENMFSVSSRQTFLNVMLKACLFM